MGNWILLIFCFIIILSLSTDFFIGYFNRKEPSLSKQLKFLDITRHILLCCQKVNEDMIFIDSHRDKLLSTLTSKALQGNLDKDDERVLKILSNKDLENLTDSLSNLVTEINFLWDSKINKATGTLPVEVVNYKKPEDAVRYFLSDSDLEACRSVYFVKKQVEKILE